MSVNSLEVFRNQSIRSLEEQVLDDNLNVQRLLLTPLLPEEVVVRHYIWNEIVEFGQLEASLTDVVKLARRICAKK